ncbi:MAG TPA: cytochrome b/b6 domain-containing protein, partial [Usitatibacter sp.]|nr:cytochrome b/b6 domain-containing protein [Usitatibacter sp.]
WDLPTRIFHWALTVLVGCSFTTGTIGGDWMPWHLRSGYAILTLVAFRLAWGVFGSDTARFAGFLRGPRRVAEYARLTLAGRHPAGVGHNPLGGWMVVAMLAALAFQAATGLFSDDEIATQGPLAVKVSNALVSRMSHLHDVGRWIVAGLVVLHVAAIATYRWAWGVRLAGAMVTGWTQAPHGMPQPRLRSPTLAAILVAAAAAAVYALVEIYPMR